MSGTAPASPAPAIRQADLPCTACGGHRDRLLFSGTEHEYPDTTEESFPVVRCETCGLVRLNPRPDVSELGRIYPPTYYAYNLVNEADTAPRGGIAGLVQRIKERMYQRELQKVLRHAALGEGTIRILDVGCADGRLLGWYKSSPEGHRIETWGIDMSDRAIEIARRRGHRVVQGRFEDDRELENGTFDLILANHVIEHVADPKAFAARATELLRPGGLFVVETPNFESADARRFGRHWGGCHFPRHWTFYDDRSIGRLAESVGLRVERIEYQANPIFWNWTCHSWLREKMPGSRLPDRLFPTVGIFHPSAQSFVLLSAFTLVDLVLRAVTGKTASMSVEMRK